MNSIFNSLHNFSQRDNISFESESSDRRSRKRIHRTWMVYLLPSIVVLCDNNTFSISAKTFSPPEINIFTRQR